MDEARINDQIRSTSVRLIDEVGNQVGIVSLGEALNRASAKNLDLVEIAPDATPPVCKILDYGKFRYEKQKKHKLNMKKQHVVQVKEIRLRPNTGDHDLLTKLTKAKKFIEDGSKLKVTVMFRGREMAKIEMGLALLERVADVLDDIAKIEKAPETEGRRMSLIMAPR